VTGRPKLNAVGRAFHDACRAELEALKPGNVHRFSDGHRMSVADFERSAEAAAPAVGRSGLSVGKRILRAVEATRKAVGQNTNLGIVLLAAPLASAALDREEGDLRARVAEVLERLTVEDACDVYKAIRLAAPGGLGKAPTHDVAGKPRVSLLEAMRAAETRDRIAFNYANGFADIFGLGLPWLKQAHDRWGDTSFAVTRVYLGFLAHLPDTLIERKFGSDIAASVLEEARPLEAGLIECQTPEAMAAPLLAFDGALKERGLNPGTSADLTVATMFAATLETVGKHEQIAKNPLARRRTIDLPMS
jgi:triphosphoribosyl-dephospho-CoA synthase